MTSQVLATDTGQTHAPRPRLGRALMIVALQLVLVAGVWGLFIDRGGDGAASLPASIGDVVSIPGGQMRVDSVLPWATVDHNMPGMQVPDAVPAGKRRVMVDVTLGAKPGGPVTYRPGLFSVSGTRAAQTAPYWGTPGLESIAPGANATVTLVFDVPKESTGLLLAMKGSSRAVAIEAPVRPGAGPPASGHGHAGG